MLPSHTHWPLFLSHSWFAPQAAQVAPPVPQDEPDCAAYASQVPVGPPAQQPVGQEDALQTHIPVVASQVWPVPHGLQAAPPTPHAVGPGVTHCPLALQQPVGHEVASQTHFPCELHSWPWPHDWHMVPFRPHEPLEEDMHCPVEPQHPLHTPPPHVHAPFEQACPLAHAPHAAPLVPQEFDDWDEYASQLPLDVQQPCGQVVASHVHLPLLHVWPEEHAVHAAPPVPHAAFVVVVTQ